MGHVKSKCKRCTIPLRLHHFVRNDGPFFRGEGGEKETDGDCAITEN